MENTIIGAQAVPQQVRASVNERMFFKTMQHLFSSSFSVMGELIQNARRAGATRIDISLDCDSRTICVTDDGIGIENFEALLCWRQFKIDHLCQLNFDQGSKAGFVGLCRNSGAEAANGR